MTDDGTIHRCTGIKCDVLCGETTGFTLYFEAHGISLIDTEDQVYWMLNPRRNDLSIVKNDRKRSACFFVGNGVIAPNKTLY